MASMTRWTVRPSSSVFRSGGSRGAPNDGLRRRCAERRRAGTSTACRPETNRNRRIEGAGFVLPIIVFTDRPNERIWFAESTLRLQHADLDR